MTRYTAHSTHSQHQVFDNLKRWTAKWCDSSEEAQRVAAEMNRAESAREHEKQDRSVLLSGAGQTKDAERTYKGIRV